MRHEMLRVRFGVHDGEPQQWVLPAEDMGGLLEGVVWTGGNLGDSAEQGAGGGGQYPGRLGGGGYVGCWFRG